MTARDSEAAARAIALIVQIRDEVELAARIPGSIVTLSRQAVESMLNDLGAASCAIREMVE